MPESVPFAMELPDRIPKQRYISDEFFQAEAEHLWTRVWQMASRLEQLQRGRLSRVPDP